MKLKMLDKVADLAQLTHLSILWDKSMSCRDVHVTDPRQLKLFWDADVLKVQAETRKDGTIGLIAYCESDDDIGKIDVEGAKL